MALAAFPGAYGWGAQSIGGRGGEIRVVSNLNDSGAGSLREAVTSSGLNPGFVVFTVAGEINLLSTIQMACSFCYIAGQTAPGSGITLLTTGGDVFRCKGNNNIIRYLSWRGVGNGFFRTSPSVDCHDNILDHCSASWGADDMINIDFGSGNEAQPDLVNTTMQNCLIGEPLLGAKACVVGGLFHRVRFVTLYNNFFVSYAVRGPQIGESDNVEVINNVHYNWKNQACEFKNIGEVDFLNDYFERGGSGTMGDNDIANRKIWRFEENDSARSGPGEDELDPQPSVHIAGNIVPDASVGLTDPTEDNFGAVADVGGARLVFHHRTPPNDRDGAKRTTPLAPAPIPAQIRTAAAAFAAVPENAGNIHRLNADGTWQLRRDSVDQGLLDDVRNLTGISEPRTVRGTLATVDAGTAYTDTDGDGMADEYEDLNGLDKNSAADRNGDASSNGYDNIEDFLNGIPILEHGGPASL